MGNACRLCLQTRPLCHSHVIPDFFLKGLEGVENGVSMVTGGAVSKTITRKRGAYEHRIGVKEYLLCLECESRLSKWEAYVKIQLYGNGTPPPLIKKVLGASVANESSVTPNEFYYDHRRVKFDYTKFKLFQLSLLWRASISKCKLFTVVNLGKRHQERIRRMLLESNPGLSTHYPCTMYDLQNPGVKWEQILERAYLDKNTKLHSYRIILGGYAWNYEVSLKRHSELLGQEIQEDGTLHIIVVNGAAVLERVVTQIKAALPS